MGGGDCSSQAELLTHKTDLKNKVSDERSAKKTKIEHYALHAGV